MTINTTDQSFNRAKTAAREGAGRLHRDAGDVDERVNGFVSAGWTGIAAQAFLEAWGDWKAAADDVEQGLASMAELLDAAQRDFNTQDADSQAALDSISALIIERLG